MSPMTSIPRRSCSQSRSRSSQAMEVIGLVVSPVKPLDAGIGMRPPPVSINMVIVPILSDYSHPEEVAPGNTGLLLFVRGVELKKHRLDPVVDPRVRNLDNPTTVAGAEDFTIHLAQLFHGEKVAVTASSMTFMPKPAVRTVVSVLGGHRAEKEKGSSYEIHPENGGQTDLCP